MPTSNELSSKTTMPVGLYSSKQLYAMEQAWFAQGNNSFALMQQAAWQMVKHIEILYEEKCLNEQLAKQGIASRPVNRPCRVSVWVGKGNNGGDGWLVAYYLQQRGWQVQVITVGFEKQDFVIKDNI